MGSSDNLIASRGDLNFCVRGTPLRRTHRRGGVKGKEEGTEIKDFVVKRPVHLISNLEKDLRD